MTYTPKLGLSLVELKALIDQLDPGCGYLEDGPRGLSWLKIGMGLHHETEGSTEGLNLFDSWSKGSPEKYPGRAAIESKWRSFGSQPGASVTARGIKRQVNLLKAKEAGKPIVNPKNAMGAARMMVDATYLTDDGISLVRCKCLWYDHARKCYQELPDSTIRTRMWHYLDGCLKHAPKGELVPVAPTKGMVDGMIDALKAVCNIEGGSPPFWRKGYTGPDPQDLISLANGLLHVPTRQLMPHTAGLFTLNTLPYEWDEDAEPKEWLKC